MSSNQNTLTANVREFLPVDYLNGNVKKSAFEQIEKICANNENTVESLQQCVQQIVEILKKTNIDKTIVNSIVEFNDKPDLTRLNYTVSSILKGIRTGYDVVKYAQDHPIARVNKFGSFYKAWVVNNDTTKKKLFGNNADKLNPSDIVLVFNEGAPEFMIRSTSADAEVRGKYAVGVSLKSTEKKTKKTGFKNPGANPFAKVMFEQLGGGGEYPDYTKGKAGYFYKNLKKVIQNVKDQIRILAVEENGLSLDTTGKLKKSDPFNKFKPYYKNPNRTIPYYQTFTALAQTLGRSTQSVLRDFLFDIYNECTKTNEGQSALMDHIFEYWFGINKLYPHYFVYEFKGNSITSSNDPKLAPYVFYWTDGELRKIMGNGRFRVVKTGIDGFEVNTEKGVNVFACRFKWGNGLGISSMKLTASSSFGEQVAGSLGSGAKSEFKMLFDPNKKYTSPNDIKSIADACKKLAGSGNLEEALHDKKLYETFFLSQFGASGKFINENKSANTHIEHMEDFIFNNGVKGARDAVNTARYIRDVLSGKVSTKNVSMKWDGSPSLVVGRDPADNKFFVAKKSAFNKNPIVYKTISEINQSDLPSELKKTFIALYRYLDHNVSGIYQGDLLFISDDKKFTNIDGVKYVTFQKNTIVYAVPETSKDLYKKIIDSKIGIAWHTKYSGSSLETLKASASNDIAPLFATKDVFSVGSGITDGVDFNLSEKDKKEIDQQLSNIGRIFQKMNPKVLNDVADNAQLKALFKSFYNSKIKQNSTISDIKKYVKELIEYIEDKYQGQIDKLKTASGKERKALEKESVLSYFTTYSESEIESLFLLFKSLSDIKHTLLKHLNKIGNMNTFIRTNEGFRVTNHEGFVVADDSGNLIKLVDRLEFSKNNFSPDVLKGWTR